MLDSRFSARLHLLRSGGTRGNALPLVPQFSTGILCALRSIQWASHENKLAAFASLIAGSKMDAPLNYLPGKSRDELLRVVLRRLDLLEVNVADRHKSQGLRR